MNLQWKPANGGEHLYVGDVWVGGISFRILARGRNDPQKWAWGHELPGVTFRFRHGHCATPDEAKKACEDSVRYWFKLAGLAT